MGRNKVLVGAAVVAAMTFAASAALGAPLSEKQWKQQGNAVCEDVNATIDAAATTAFSGVEEGRDPTPEEAQAFATAFVAALRDGASGIEALAEPKALRRNVKKFVTEVEAVATRIEDDPSVLLDEKPAGPDPFAKVDKLAKNLGLKTCANQ